MKEIFGTIMARRNQNLKYASKLKGNKPIPITDKYPTFISSQGSKRENREAKSSKAKNLSKFQKYVYSDENFEYIDTENIDDNIEVSQGIFKITRNSNTKGMGNKLKEELNKYRNELKEYTISSKDLEEKYQRINTELNAMKEKHDRLIKKRNLPCGYFDTYSDSSSTASVYSLQRKCNQLFNASNSFLREQPLKVVNCLGKNLNKQNISILKYQKTDDSRILAKSEEDKENILPYQANNDFENNLQNVYLTIKNVIEDRTKSQQNADVLSLKKTVNKLQNDSERFVEIIEQQNNTLSDYRSRFVKTQKLVKEQQFEIEKLTSDNQQLEVDASHIIDQLRHKIETKLKDVNVLSQIIKDEQLKRERVTKENCLLNERIQSVQADANQLKIKLDEMNRRKMSTISRLKVAERDLKIFKTYNGTLKQEKQKLSEDLKAMSKHIENLQNNNKRSMSRHREQSEKQRRDLQKRIFDLEMKLNRSQTSTTSLIQERDTLIAELQSQLNNLVHNFEVSQKHIRVLRKHIYNMCGNTSRQPLMSNSTFVANV